MSNANVKPHMNASSSVSVAPQENSIHQGQRTTPSRRPTTRIEIYCMTPEEQKASDRIRQGWSDLIFGVRRSIRYHTRRRKFFDALSVWADFLIIISGGTAVAFAVGEAKKSKATVILGAIIAVVGTLDLVIGFSTKARDYHDLVKEFSALEREMTAAGDAKTKENLAKFKNRRLEIEEEEPPILRVLNNYCHNELCRATDKDDKYFIKISWYQSLFKQWFDLFPSTMKSKAKIAEEQQAKTKAENDKAAVKKQTTVLA